MLTYCTTCGLGKMMPSVPKLSRVSKSKVDTEDGPGSLCALQPGSLDSLSGDTDFQAAFGSWPTCSRFQPAEAPGGWRGQKGLLRFSIGLNLPGEPWLHNCFPLGPQFLPSASPTLDTPLLGHMGSGPPSSQLLSPKLAARATVF